MAETSNKIVSMAFYPVVYQTNTNNDFVLDTDGNKVVDKGQNEVSSTDDYSFVTVKELLNHGKSTFVGLRLN
jgi:hypothetical protein